MGRIWVLGRVGGVQHERSASVVSRFALSDGVRVLVWLRCLSVDD